MATPSRTRRLCAAVHGAAGGLGLDLALYCLAGLFAWATATSSVLAPHRAWGAVAATGYAAAAVATLVQLALRRWTPTGSRHPLCGVGARTVLAVVTWCTTALVPLVLLSVARAGGRIDRAQEEVLVIEDGGQRMLAAGTPYLSRAEIAALPDSERLLGYLPYQPAMALFGLPRALDPGHAWWSDARVWFALVTAVALAAALLVLRSAGASGAMLLRGLQVATVLPVCALTLATGGDDLPVLALCLLALALAATSRPAGAGLAAGAAAALKLFAWPVALVLAVHALRRRTATPYAAGAVGLPLITALPALAGSPAAMVENVLAFPLGRGLVASPAASPLPGHLVATWLPQGRTVATALVLIAGAVIAVWLVRRPPGTAAHASLVCGVGLLAAILLLPATRFGYLLYPAAFLVWVPVLRDAATGSGLRSGLDSGFDRGMDTPSGSGPVGVSGSAPDTGSVDGLVQEQDASVSAGVDTKP